jgi:dienelactone hydrolase
MTPRFWSVLFVVLPLCAPAQDSRRDTMELLLHVVPPSRVPDNGRLSSHENTWEEWAKRTGAQPPDFDSMPSNPDLPDPLVLRENGRAIPVTSLALWERQKQWIRKQTEQWISGGMPPKPDNLRAVVTATRREGTTTVRDVRLEFGPEHRGVLHLQLIVPSGKGPFPVFLTNHALNLPWLYTAVRRGYIGCYYSATDPHYRDPDDSDRYIELYPEYDFSCLGRWGWSASRAVDYLYTLPEVEKSQIGLAGHSRNGKQALAAAVFDERIGAVILSSGNTGEAEPWRYTSDMYVNESIELLTGGQPHWFHPRLRFFAGREDKLPVDQNMLMASIAPRGLMIYSAYSESANNPFGFEQAYRSVLRAYRFLGHEEKVWLHLRNGEHPTTAGDVENFMDFFDAVFGRKPHPKSETWILGYTFDGWQKISRDNVDPLAYPERTPGDFLAGVAAPAQWEERKKSIRKRITQVLGEAPPRVPFAVHRRLSETVHASDGWLPKIYNRPSDDKDGRARIAGEGMGLAAVPFGDGLKGDLYYPLAPDGRPKPGKWPVVIWLHPYTYQNGWSAARTWLSGPNLWAYYLDERPSFPSLTRRGFAVFAFDHVGFGSRIHEFKPFYQRYPKWSILGNMIADTRSAIDAMAALEEIDASGIYLAGYALGAKVGLLTAAFDDRIAGLVSVCGFDPLRLDTADKAVEGIRQYSHLHGLAPRMGFFVGHEDRLPFDFDEVLALAAPKPVLLIAPTLDRYARVADVRREVAESAKVYRLLGRERALQFETPLEINRFAHAQQERAFDWIAETR